MALLYPSQTALAQTSLEFLRAHVSGDVIIPGDAQYDDARKAWELTIDQYPAVIVMAESAADVVAAVRFANEANLNVAVQTTGHGISRSADDHAVLINLARMNHVEVNAEAQTAWVEGGAKWEVVIPKTQEVGLAPLVGSTPDVGAVGYTLGGGMGWIGRKYGLSTDSVNYFDVVTASGRIVRASATENSDLFWGLRGGGGSFGVVVGMEIKLYPVTQLFTGNLIYPVEVAKEVFSRYRQWIANAPEELTSSIVVMNFPPIPDVPEFLQGKSGIMVRGAYVGSMEEGQALIQYWLDWMEPIANLFGPLPFSQIAAISNDPKDPVTAKTTTVWLKDLGDEVADILIERGLAANGSPVMISEVRHAGGAMSRGSEYPNAYGNRDATLVLEMIGFTPTPESEDSFIQYTDQTKRELQAHLTGGVYINFLIGEEKWARTQQAFSPENYRRLIALKGKYDPNNIFRYSFNIPPFIDTYER